MRGAALSLAPVLLLAAAACTDAESARGDEKRAAPADPVVSAALKVTAEPAAATVQLGRPITVRVRLENTGDAPEKVNVPRLGRHSVTIRVRSADGKVQWLDRLHQDMDPRTGNLTWKMPRTAVVAPGETLTGDVPVIACLPGKQTLVVQYKRAGADAVTAEPFEVEVEAPEGRTSLGAQIETTHGKLVVRLRPDLALNTVESFASLVSKGFYDGVTFHRIVAGFMAQGGDPMGTGGGGPGYFLPLEAHSGLLHQRGVLSMARTNIPDTAGSQFFLMFARNQGLDPRGPGTGYTAFGEMVSGDETLQALEKVPTRVNPAMVEQLRARGYSGAELDRLVERLVASRQLEKSQPTERVAIEKATLVTLD